MHVQTRDQFFRAIGNSHQDDFVIRIGDLLGELESEQVPVLQALLLCEIFKQCSAFHRHQKQVTTSPFITPYVLPVPQLPPGGMRARSANVVLQQRTRPVTPVRQRANAMTPMHTIDSSSVHATFLRTNALKEIESEVTKELCNIFQCTPNILPNRIEERFATVMTAHGIKTDELTVRNGKQVRKLEEAELQATKVIFERGLGYVMELTAMALTRVKADTRKNNQKNDKHRIWCYGYVFTENGLFMRNHRVPSKKGVFFHSSYTSGGDVLCAGDISFSEGQLTSISNMSGHYQPENRKLVKCLEFLKKNQVNLDQVRVVLNSDVPKGLDAASALQSMSSKSEAKPFEPFSLASSYSENFSQTLRSGSQFLADPLAMVLARR